jgi:hypothetical protein
VISWKFLVASRAVGKYGMNNREHAKTGTDHKAYMNVEEAKRSSNVPRIRS